MQKKGNTNNLGKTISRRLKSIFKVNPNKFLKKINGIIHVGANTGQEIGLYARYGLSVVWIEPIPEVFETLKVNLKNFPKQVALKGLVTDFDNVNYQFHLANNNGASSSILDLKLHQDIWPDVSFKKTIHLQSLTLPSLLKINNIKLAEFDMLVMDTQGSELLVLEGSKSIMHNFKYVKTEVPDFEAYKGCCQLKDLQSFMINHGYIEVYRNKFASHPNGGSYYDIMYKKQVIH